MASLKNTSSYVKFVRGTYSAWESLKTQNQVADDTLYFIYENKDAEKGVLFLGHKQIGGEENLTLSLDQLTNVEISDELAKKDILVFDGEDWVNSTLEEILSFDNKVLELDELGALTLAGFKDAQVGQIPQVTSAGLSWTSVNDLSEIQSIRSSIIELEENKLSEVEVKELIADANHLQYTIVENLESIDPEQIENPNSYIYLVPTGDTTGINLYDEYMFINDKLEQVGNWDIDLSNYVTESELNTTLTRYITSSIFETEIGALEDQISDLEAVDTEIKEDITDILTFVGQVGNLDDLITYEENYTLVNQVNELSERLTWQEIEE